MLNKPILNYAAPVWFPPHLGSNAVATAEQSTGGQSTYGFCLWAASPQGPPHYPLTTPLRIFFDHEEPPAPHWSRALSGMLRMRGPLPLGPAPLQLPCKSYQPLSGWHVGTTLEVAHFLLPVPSFSNLPEIPSPLHVQGGGISNNNTVDRPICPNYHITASGHISSQSKASHKPGFSGPLNGTPAVCQIAKRRIRIYIYIYLYICLNSWWTLISSQPEFTANVKEFPNCLAQLSDWQTITITLISLTRATSTVGRAYQHICFPPRMHNYPTPLLFWRIVGFWSKWTPHYPLQYYFCFRYIMWKWFRNLKKKKLSIVCRACQDELIDI